MTADFGDHAIGAVRQGAPVPAPKRQPPPSDAAQLASGRSESSLGDRCSAVYTTASGRSRRSGGAAAVTPQICINAVSVHPNACEGHVPPGIYWYQGQIWNGTYQYMDTNTGCSMYYPTYQGPYVAVTSDDD